MQAPDTALSRTRTSFYRRLYVAYLIDQGKADVPTLVEQTGMPRRTAQDTIASLADLDIDCQFEQDDKRHNSGQYRVKHWGPINPDWVSRHAQHIGELLGYR